MKLTKDYVERLKARWDKHQVSESGIGDLCEDWLAEWKMLDQIEREQRICHWCGAVLQGDMKPEDRLHGSECPFKEFRE